MDLSPDSRITWKDLLMRPGSIIGLLGLIILGVAIVGYAFFNPSVDLVAHPELAGTGGGGIKFMVWMVGGIVLILIGAVLSLLDFQRR